MTSYQLWERIFPQEKRWLGGIVTCSLVLHVAVFFVFHIEKVPDSRSVVRPPRIVFISGDSGANRLDGSDPMKWINWRDPAVIALPRAPIPEPLPLNEGRTSVRQEQALPELPEWKPLELEKTKVAETLEEYVKSSIQASSAKAMPLNVEAPPQLSGTVVTLQGDLKGRGVVERVKMPRPQTKVSLKATEYYVRVLSGGTVIQVKVNQSSGSTEIDQQGLAILKQWRFAAVESEVPDIWSKVTVFWDFQEENSDQEEILF